MKYLYYQRAVLSQLGREEIVRESDCYYFVGKNEQKVSKSTMITGKSPFRTYYYEETPALVAEYALVTMKRNYREKIEKLLRCEDESVMLKVLAIELPAVKNSQNNG